MSWVDRLRDFGIEYGQLPGTQTLWDAATATSDDVMARLALVNLLHEARGLDTFVNSHKVSPFVGSIARLWAHTCGLVVVHCIADRGVEGNGHFFESQMWAAAGAVGRREERDDAAAQL